MKAGECLYRNSASGTYYALVKLRGKQFKASLKTKALPEARRKLREFRQDIGRVDPKAGKITLAALVDRYLATVGHQSPSTVAKKKAIGERVRKHWGRRQAREITKFQVLKWRAELKETHSGKALGVTSRNKCLRFLRAMFNLGVDDGLLLVSPIAGVKEEKIPKPIRPTPSLEDFQAIVGSIRMQPLADTREESADLVEFLGAAGLGLAEAHSLTWGDVDFERDEITTFRRKTRKGFVVPIYPQLRPLLEKRLKLVMEANAGETPSPVAKVFAVANAKKSIEAACLRLGMVQMG